VHPLKVISLFSWFILLICQLTLPWLTEVPGNYWALLLALPLLLPGISELVSNPHLRIYGFATTVASMLLFLASIYYARYLGLRQKAQD